MCAFVYLYVDMFMLCIFYFLSLNTATTKPIFYFKIFIDNNNIRSNYVRKTQQLGSFCTVSAFLT